MWVVDTCILIDIADEDPQFGKPSANCLATHSPQGLCVSPVTYVELAPVFSGSRRELDGFLKLIGAEVMDFNVEDRAAAFRSWNRHISGRRAGTARRRPVADVLIGALAERHQGLITRNSEDFKALYPKIVLVVPSE